jgi:hypothetical protein
MQSISDYNFGQAIHVCHIFASAMAKLSAGAKVAGARACRSVFRQRTVEFVRQQYEGTMKATQRRVISAILACISYLMVPRSDASTPFDLNAFRGQVVYLDFLVQGWNSVRTYLRSAHGLAGSEFAAFRHCGCQQLHGSRIDINYGPAARRWGACAFGGTAGSIR